MFIKKSPKIVNGKKYVNHLLVESVNTPKGPRHKVICSLGNLDPGPPEKWQRIAQNIQKSLSGQQLLERDPVAEQVLEKIKVKHGASGEQEADARWLQID